MTVINLRRWLAAKTLRTFLIPAVIATGTAFAAASPAAADIVRIQHVSSGRYLDAWEDSGHGFNAVIWTQQNNDTQLWERTRISGDVYTLQQVSNDRFLDAWEDDGHDFQAVAWTPQANDSQRWLMTDLGGGIFRIQQVNTGRYLDAHETADQDWRAVTRPFQNNTTQQWRVTPVLSIIPPLIGSLVIITPDPPVPPIHAQGTFQLPSPMTANLDNGAVALFGGDLAYNAPDLLNLQLTPLNGAQISFTTGAQRNFGGCSTAAFSTSGVLLSALSPGNYICFKTDEGHVSEFQITAIGSGLFRQLSIAYRTWQ